MGAAQSGIQGIFQAGLSLIPVIGPILSQFAGPLLEGIKAIGGKILGIFSGLFKSTASFRSERASGIFGAFTVPQSVLDSIGQMSAQISKAGRALPDTIASLVGFDDVIKAVGITDMPQFMFAMGKGDEAVQRLKEGLITGAEAADFFGNESLRIMKEAAIELGGTAVAEFDNMIRKAVEAGVVIPAEFTAAAAAVVENVFRMGNTTRFEVENMTAAYKNKMDAILAMDNITTDEQIRLLEVLKAQHALTMQDMTSTAAAASQAAVDSATTSAAAIVVTEEEKNAALRTILALDGAFLKKTISESERAQADAARAVVKSWEDATGKVSGLFTGMTGVMGGAIGKVAGAVTGFFQGTVDEASTTATQFSDAFVNAGDRINDTFRDMKFDIPVGFSLGDIPRPGTGGVTELAHGGIVTQPTVALIGEAGPEAVVPLTGRGGGGGGSIDLTISAEGIGLLARKTVELTPDILREFGIG